MTHAQRGFVLPFALAVIAMMAVIAMLSAGIVSRAQQNMIELAARQGLAFAAASAEADAIFVFLTAAAAPHGLNISNRPLDEGGILLGEYGADISTLTKAETWTANGETRLAQYDGIVVLVSLQDVAGLISLQNTLDTDLFAVLTSFGIERTAVRALIAALRDFIDEDNVRQFEGGERADYRLLNERPPSNSPLRTLTELYDVLGWPQTGVLSMDAFVDLATPALGAPSPNPAVSPPGLAQRLPEESRLGPLDPADAALSQSPYASSIARLKLIAIDQTNGFGIERIIEVERAPDAVDTPFRRKLIREKSLTRAEVQNVAFEGVLPLFRSEPAGD